MNGFFSGVHYVSMRQGITTYFMRVIEKTEIPWIAPECFDSKRLYDWQKGVPARLVVFTTLAEAQEAAEKVIDCYRHSSTIEILYAKDYETACQHVLSLGVKK